MMKPLLLLLLGLLPQLAAAQSTINKPLKHELDSIYAVDHEWRIMLLSSDIHYHPDTLAKRFGIRRQQVVHEVHKRRLQADSTNQVRMRQILKQYGYPGKSLVGEPTNEAAWYIIQHSDTIGKYLPLIKKAAEKGEMPFYLYAQMLDRQLMREGKEQLYGTQAYSFLVVNPKTGRREGQPTFVWPIKDVAGVNERRQKAGFPTTVEQNAANLGIPYRVLTLQDVAKMPK